VNKYPVITAQESWRDLCWGEHRVEGNCEIYNSMWGSGLQVPGQHPPDNCYIGQSATRTIVIQDNCHPT